MEQSKNQDTDRRALVTGGGQRIGKAICLGLARDGYAVGVHYRQSADEAEATVAQIAAAGGKAVAVAADLTDPRDTSGLVGRAAEALGGPLSVLVNNASHFERDDPLSASQETWDLHMEVNLHGPFILCQEFFRQLQPAADDTISANIVNIIDQRVWNLTPYFTTYSLSKAGLMSLTQILARSFAPRVRVNAIGPGPVLASHFQSEEQFSNQCKETPLQRKTRAEEIYEAIGFILGAPAMTGQMIALDGGQHMGWAQSSHPDPNEG